MRKIKAQKLSVDAFNRFGSFTDLLHPEGHDLGGFYPDRVLFPVKFNAPVGFSPLVVHKRDAMVVDSVEYHDHTGEIILPLDTDIVIHVAPASNKLIPEKTEAFIVPKGTLVRLNAGVYHLCPFSIEKETGHVLIALPERTYKTDCVVSAYQENEQLEITL